MNELSDFYSLSEVAKKEGSTEHELIRSAANGDVSLYVWFEGLLLTEIGPATINDLVRDGVTLLPSPEYLDALSKGKVFIRRGMEKFRIHSPHRGFLKLPADEIPGFMARQKVKISSLIKDGITYLCHETELSEYENFKRDHDRVRRLCEGSMQMPEYTVSSLFLHGDEVLQRDNAPAGDSNSEDSYSDFKVIGKEALMRGLGGYKWSGVRGRCKKYGVEISHTDDGEPYLMNSAVTMLNTKPRRRHK